VTAPLTTLKKPLAQLAFCRGCCCGRTDRGKPDLPVDRLKAAWAAGGLNRAVQLTVSGCLGPCDLTNVTLVLTPGGQVWLGRLDGDADYDALIGWAEACRAAGEVVPLPARFDARRFDRWPAPPPAEAAT
jgi:cobaltochelatase CobN